MQLKLVTARATTQVRLPAVPQLMLCLSRRRLRLLLPLQLWRDTEYVTNKIALHISSALFSESTGWVRRHLRAPTD